VFTVIDLDARILVLAVNKNNPPKIGEKDRGSKSPLKVSELEDRASASLDTDHIARFHIGIVICTIRLLIAQAYNMITGKMRLQRERSQE
jgi:hypothetical protein